MDREKILSEKLNVQLWAPLCSKEHNWVRFEYQEEECPRDPMSGYTWVAQDTNGLFRVTMERFSSLKEAKRDYLKKYKE